MRHLSDVTSLYQRPVLAKPALVACAKESPFLATNAFLPDIPSLPPRPQTAYLSRKHQPIPYGLPCSFTSCTACRNAAPDLARTRVVRRTQLVAQQLISLAVIKQRVVPTGNSARITPIALAVK